MVDIRALVPDMAQDIRSAGGHNFVGTPIDGYEAPRCYLLRPVAPALPRVEAALRDSHRGRKRVREGTCVSVRVDIGGRRISKIQKHMKHRRDITSTYTSP